MLLTLILIMLTVSVVLILVGLRGRHIGTDPHCRACGFNVAGVRDRSPRCTECGAGIVTPELVRIGQHQRRVWAIVVGVVLLVMGSLPATLLFSGVAVRKYLPTAVLIQELRWMEEERAELAADELLKRHIVGKLDADQTLALAERALEVYSDDRWYKGPVWSDALAYPTIGSTLPLQHQNALLLRGLHLELEFNRRVRSGSRLLVDAAVGFELKAMATIQRQTSLGPVVVEFISTDGQLVHHHVDHEIRVTPPMNGWREFLLMIPCDLPLGRYHVRLCATMSVANLWAGAPVMVTKMFEGQVQVLGPNEPLIEVVNDPRLIEHVRQGLQLRFNQDRRRVDLSVGMKAETSPELVAAMEEGLKLVYECFLPLADQPKELSVGVVRVSRRYGRWWDESHFIFSAIPAGDYLMTLRPFIEDAERRIGATTILGGPIEFEVTVNGPRE